MLQIH